MRSKTMHRLALVAAMSLSGGAFAASFTPGDLAVFSADSATANNTTFTIVEVNPTSDSSPQSISINGTTGTSATCGPAARRRVRDIWR